MLFKRGKKDQQHKEKRKRLKGDWRLLRASGRWQAESVLHWKEPFKMNVWVFWLRIATTITGYLVVWTSTGLQQNYTTKATQSSRQPVEASWFSHTSSLSGEKKLEYRKWTWIHTALFKCTDSSKLLCHTLSHSHLFASTDGRDSHTWRRHLFKLTDTLKIFLFPRDTIHVVYRCCFCHSCLF